MTKVRGNLLTDTISTALVGSITIVSPWFWVRVIGVVLLSVQSIVLIHFRYWSKQLIHFHDPSLFPEMEHES